MILIVHLLFGAAIGSIVKNMPLAIFLAFLSHYFLDLFPHVEYNIENIKKKQWRRMLPQFLSIFLDFLMGILLISLFSDNHPLIYICAFFAVLPDVFSILNLILESRILQAHSNLHQQKIHFLANKKIPVFWRILIQVLVAIASVFLLRI